MTKPNSSSPAWLDQCDPDDPARALELAVADFGKVAFTGSERMHWLLQFDDYLAPFSTSLIHTFAEARRQPILEENRKWDAGSNFHDQFAAQLIGLLRHAGGQVIPASDVPGILVRILSHRYRAALWRHLRYIAMPAGWWLDTHKIYAFAEREQISTAEAVIRTGQPATCVTSIYLQLLLLDTLNRTNMDRRQIVAVSDWLERQTDGTRLEREFDDETQLFYVKIDEDSGGHRIRNLEPAPNCRYWQMDAMLAEIEIEMSRAEAGQATDIEAQLLRQMAAEWVRAGYKRQRRSDERNDVRKKAYVAHGIYAVCQEVHSQSLGSTKTMLEGDAWIIENESLYGFGALVSNELNAWLKVGRLITLREEMNFGMSVVAVIRSLKQQDDGMVYIGAEVLSHMALYAQLQDWPDELGHRYPSIFLAADPEHHMPSSLLIPQIEYQPEGELRLKLDRRMRHVKLGKLLEAKDDWCRVAIDVMEDLA